MKQYAYYVRANTSGTPGDHQDSDAGPIEKMTDAINLATDCANSMATVLALGGVTFSPGAGPKVVVLQCLPQSRKDPKTKEMVVRDAMVTQFTVIGRVVEQAKAAGE